MANQFSGQTAHSAEYFGDTRDHWWNADFLQLMARRWKFETVSSVLDVGCGVGHWGALLGQVLPAEARIVGIDSEQSWVEQATERARKRGANGRFWYQAGTAQKLPFPDNTFDLTTCQTVLIHVPDPDAVIAEMIRVTKAGGLVAVAEPNNIASALVFDSLSATMTIDDVVELTRFQLTCERGKAALGEGNNSVGDLIPGYFAAQGLQDVTVFTSDKAFSILPPYATLAERAHIEEIQDFTRRSFWIWNREDTLRFFVSGGGATDTFESHWQRALAARHRMAQAMETGSYHTAGGSICYLISGRKLG